MTDENETPREPWETITKYGRADMTLHPVLRDCYRVACLIERCGASVELTRASSAAFDLCETMFDAIMRLCETGINDQNEAEQLRAENALLRAESDRLANLAMERGLRR